MKSPILDQKLRFCAFERGSAQKRFSLKFAIPRLWRSSPSECDTCALRTPGRAIVVASTAARADESGVHFWGPTSCTVFGYSATVAAKTVQEVGPLKCTLASPPQPAIEAVAIARPGVCNAHVSHSNHEERLGCGVVNLRAEGFLVENAFRQPK